MSKYKVETPCGKQMGHGETCCEDRLCGSCREIRELRKQIEAPWISIKNRMPKELREDCANPHCFAPDRLCEGCPGEDNLLVVRDQIEQRLIEEASFIDGNFYSLTGHQLHDVTHWQTSKHPERE